MTITDTETTRRPITDVVAWLDNQGEDVRRALLALGELLSGATDRPPKSESAEIFTKRCLGVASYSGLIDEARDLNAVQRLTVALALAELMAEHAALVEVGSGEYSHPPAWTETRAGDQTFHHPQCLRAAFPAGTLPGDAPCVIGIDARSGMVHDPSITAYVRRKDQAGARVVLDRIMTRADELNPYRGRASRATYNGGLEMTVIDLPTSPTRATVVVDKTVWREIDLGITAVRDRHEMLNSHGLGSRRGVLLVGPPGTGKSAVSAVIAAEQAGAFTVIYVEARAGERLLTAVVEEAQRIGGPVLLILEDVDLWCQDRNRSASGGLSELLQAMDIAADARILTLASTNNAATLDKAAIRTGRFDSIVEVGYPNRADAARILAALLADLPGGDAVDTAAVAAALPGETSGSDLREIVRRAVLTGDGEMSTATLLAEVGTGRYRAQVPAGTYL